MNSPFALLLQLAVIAIVAAAFATFLMQTLVRFVFNQGGLAV
jgi:hypothetical protein